MLDFFRTGPDRPLVSNDPAVIQSLYERKRWSVFLSVTLGYGMFYLCRENFGVVKKPMLDAGVLTTTEMGLIGSTAFVVYAVGKLVNGVLADRANVRRFMATGLLVSALANLVFGFSHWFWLYLAMWALSAWAQGTGSAPSVVAISHWFSTRERGTRYGIWSTAHSIGEGLTFVGTAVLVARTDWTWGFWGPGLVCVASALVLYRTLADRPETCGLPHISVYKDDPAAAQARQAAVGRVQLEILKNFALWRLGLASACMYMARYGMNNWGVLYLQEVKGYGLEKAGFIMGMNSLLGLAGAATSGWVSDRFFRSRRNAPALLYGLAQTGALVGLFLTPPGHPWVDTLWVALFGFALGGILVFLGGLMAVDLVPQKATGAAMGMIGLFSYLGAAVQDSVSGWLLDAHKTVVDGQTFYDFTAATWSWVGASTLSILLAASVWGARRKE